MFRLLSLRVAAVTVAGLATAAGGGFALANAVGGAVPSSTAKAAALDRLRSVATTDSNTVPAPAPPVGAHAIQARMLGSETPVPIAPSLLQPRNGWLVSNGRTLVAVYAGAAGNDSSVGRVVIVRQDLAAGKQTVQALDAGRTGALTIAVAPLGGAVETSAQTAILRLRTAAGRSLSLDLGAGKVGG